MRAFGVLGHQQGGALLLLRRERWPVVERQSSHGDRAATAISHCVWVLSHWPAQVRLADADVSFLVHAEVKQED